MNHKFDELAKGMAQSVTRRAALKKFGLGLAGMALACFGLANKTEAKVKSPSYCEECIENCKNQGQYESVCRNYVCAYQCQ